MHRNPGNRRLHVEVFIDFTPESLTLWQAVVVIRREPGRSRLGGISMPGTCSPLQRHTRPHMASLTSFMISCSRSLSSPPCAYTCPHGVCLQYSTNGDGVGPSIRAALSAKRLGNHRYSMRQQRLCNCRYPYYGGHTESSCLARVHYKTPTILGEKCPVPRNSEDIHGLGDIHQFNYLVACP